MSRWYITCLGYWLFGALCLGDDSVSEVTIWGETAGVLAVSGADGSGPVLANG